MAVVICYAALGEIAYNKNLEYVRLALSSGGRLYKDP